jgi:hypothetical protein
MNDAMVTFTGWVGNEVTHRETKEGNVANFRVGSTPRIRKRNGTGSTARRPGSRWPAGGRWPTTSVTR